MMFLLSKVGRAISVPRMSFRMNSLLGKQTLALIRGGDYAHPGEEESIIRVFEHLPKSSDQQLLDVGCGIGGTAAFIQNKGWGKVTGIDVDFEVLEMAKKKYIQSEFVNCDVESVSRILKNKFEIIYCFCSFYAFARAHVALKQMRKVAKSNATLMIFDYVDRRPANDKAPEALLFPSLKLPSLSKTLAKTGWKKVKTVNLDQHFQVWYEDLVREIHSKRVTITNLGGAEWYNYVEDRYRSVLGDIQKNRLGGAALYMEREFAEPQP